MAVSHRCRRCLQCGSTDIREIGRIEAGELPDLDEDAAIYQCGECGHEWDSAMCARACQQPPPADG